MLVTYEEYQGLGYGKVSEELFERYERLAAAYVLHRVFSRIEKDEDNPIWQQNRIGLCELIDARYATDIGENAALSSFSNSRYSEVYLSVNASRIKTPEDIYNAIIELFFTAEQRSRYRRAYS